MPEVLSELTAQITVQPSTTQPPCRAIARAAEQHKRIRAATRAEFDTALAKSDGTTRLIEANGCPLSH
jgi:hypothetical protein